MAKIEIGDSSVNGYDDDSLEILCERNMFGAVEKWRKKWFSEKIVELNGWMEEWMMVIRGSDWPGPGSEGVGDYCLHSITIIA